MASSPTSRITEEEYLRLERAVETKSELIHGEIVARPGGSLERVMLAAKWSAELGLKLRGRDLMLFDSQLRIRTPDSGSYVCPDASVVRGQPQTHQSADDILTNPTAVIEVLSPSSEDYRWATTFEFYREIASLQDYILVHTGSIYVEHFSRQPGSWLFREYHGADSSITIESIGCTVLLGDVYDGIPGLPAPQTGMPE